MTLNPITFRRSMLPAALGLALLGASPWVMAQTDAPAAPSSTTAASQSMTMKHGADMHGMHGKTQTTAAKTMPPKNGRKSMSYGTMMGMSEQPAEKSDD